MSSARKQPGANKRAVVLVSGGMDSAVVLAMGSACRSPVDADGTVTASITGSSLTIENGTPSTIYYTAFVEPPGTVLDWTVWFLILMCTAMLVEGLLDLHVARTGGEEHFSKEHHADAI